MDADEAGMVDSLMESPMQVADRIEAAERLQPGRSADVRSTDDIITFILSASILTKNDPLGRMAGLAWMTWGWRDEDMPTLFLIRELSGP